MRINRKALLDELYSFSREDSGLIVGKPGIGKSYLIRELHKKLSSEDIIVFVIRIDNTYDFTDEAIQDELELTDNWLETFKKIESYGEQKAILIFDAFDAARDERLRKGFLNQIKKAKRELSDKWNILVSVRTYDAGKSPELIRLFPRHPGSGHSSFYSRNFEIGPLNDDEVTQALRNDQLLQDFYEASSSELKDILHIPFFLEIMEKVVLQASTMELDHFQKFKSESQILQVFWDKKVLQSIDSVALELILSQLTKTLVIGRTLNTNKLEFLGNLINPHQNGFNYLRSENIIDEVSLHRSRIAFSHNILFDFAVNYYCLSEDYQTLLDFIEADLTRPFFLRPSFIYFFTALWYANPDRFWLLYWKLLANIQKEIQLLVRLILNGIISSEYATTNDLFPILKNEHIANKSETIRNLMQTFRFIRPLPNESDIDLLVYLSDNPDLVYLFDVAFLLAAAIENKNISQEYFSRAGYAARNILNYTLEQRNTPAKSFVDRIGATRGVELVTKTYATDKVASKLTIEKVLELIKEPDFDIWWITNLAEDVKYLIGSDPETVALVYLAVFGYRETSEQTTNMGSSVIANFTSNRRQDYEMCYYRLQRLYPEFLEAAPSLAIITGMQIVNNFIRFDRHEGLLDETIVEFEFHGIRCKFQPDYSGIWSEHTHGNPTDLLKDIIKMLTDSLTDPNQNTQQLMDLYIEQAFVGFTWKLLLQWVIDHPHGQASYFYDLLINPVILKSSETSYEARELIAIFADEYSNSQIKVIEKTAFQVYKGSSDITLSRVLSRIPEHRVQLKKTKDFLSVQGKVENQPGYTFSSSSSAYTTDMWLEDNGVNLKDPKLRELSDLSNQLSPFNHQWGNGEPQADVYRPFLKIAEQALQLLKDTPVPDNLYYSVLNEISQAAAIIIRDYKNLSQTELELVKKHLIMSFSYISEYDKKLSGKHSAQMSYSPTPRISAAEGLIYLYCAAPSATNLKILKTALADKNSVVRLSASRRLQILYGTKRSVYDQIIKDRLSHETDSFVYAVLLTNLVFYIKTIQEQGAELLNIIAHKESLFKESETFQQNYADLLLFLLHEYQVPMAFQILNDAYANEKLCGQVIFSMFEKMHPSYTHNNFTEQPDLYQDELSIVSTYIKEAGNVLQNLQLDELNRQTPGANHALMVIDKVIQRIYFLLDAKKYPRQNFELPINENNRKGLYFSVKPLYQQVISISSKISNQGFILGHTAHYFIESLNLALPYDPEEILSMVSYITKYSLGSGYTFDSHAIQEMVGLTEKLLADYRYLLLENEPFQNLLNLLDIYINSGWVNALELLWRLDEIFR